MPNQCILAEEQEDEVSIAEIENACKKLREIKGVEPRKRNADVRRRQMSELNALANTMGFDFGVLADGGEQTLTEGQTLAQALQVHRACRRPKKKTGKKHALEIYVSFFF